MPINYPQFRRLTAQDMGGLGGIDLAGSINSGLKNAQSIQEARFRPQNLQQELYAKQLANKINEAKAQYAPEQELANLNYTKAGTGNLGAQTALHQGQLGLLPFEKQLKIAQMQQAMANAEKARVLGGLYGKVGNLGQAQQNSPQQMGYADQLQQHMENPKSMENNPQQMNPNQANLIAGLLKLPVSSQVVNGQLVTNNPLTGITSTKVGPSSQENAFATGLGKYGAKLYEDNVNSYRGLQNQGLALNELVDAAENHPEFKNVTGRINQPLTNWFGTPEQKELLGRLQSTSGEIALQVAPSLKGAFTGRDQTLINTIKASPNDFPDVFIGKLKAQKLINDVLQKRSELTAQYIEGGYKPLEAARIAAQNTPIEQFKPQVDQLIQHKESLSPEQLNLAKAELARRKGVQ